jgi:hypothetical protein
VSAFRASSTGPGVPGETDLLLRNGNTGGVEIYNINNDQLTGAAFIGTVGLDWQFASGAPGPRAGCLRLAGQFEVYDISNNQITGAALLEYGRLGLAAWLRRRRSSDCPGHIHRSLERLTPAGNGQFRLRQRQGSQQLLLTTPQHA